MLVSLHHEGSVTILKPSGPLLAGELEELEKQLQELARSWTGRVLLNLADVPFIDSAGLELVCRNHQVFAGNGLSLKLSNLTELTRKIFEITRLSRRFEIYPDSTAAVRSFL